MTLLIFTFAGILLVTFIVVAVLTTPTKFDKAVQHRLATVTGDKTVQQDATLEASELLRKTPSQGTFGFLEDFFKQHASMQKLRNYVSQAGVNTTASAVFVQSLAIAAIGFLAAMLLYPIIYVEAAAPVVAGVLPWLRIWWARGRRLKAFNKALPQGIDMMARALRAGHSTSGAIEIIAEGSPEPAASEFREVFRQQNFGLPMREALMQLLDRVPSQDLRVLVTAIVIQRETGGNLVEILDRTSFVIRERQRIYGEIKTQTAQGRMTGWILSAMPIGLMVLINMMNPGYSRVLFTTPTGHIMLGIGAGLISIGFVVINKIVNSIEV